MGGAGRSAAAGGVEYEEKYEQENVVTLRRELRQFSRMIRDQKGYYGLEDGPLLTVENIIRHFIENIPQEDPKAVISCIKIDSKLLNCVKTLYTTAMLAITSVAMDFFLGEE